MSVKTKTGKGATRARVGGTSFRPKPKGDVLSIGSLTPLVVSSAPVLSQKAAIAAGEADLRCGDKGSLKTRLEPGANLIQGKLTTIEDLMESLSLAGGRELEKEVEIEVRMLYGSDPNDPDSFQRVRLWLEQLFPEVQPVDFQERRYNVPSERIGSGFIASYVWRGATDMYIKIKNKKMISLALPSIHNIIPCLGVSVESRSFQFDTSQNPGEQTQRRRWSFPINSFSAVEKGIDYGFPVAFTDQTAPARGSIDLTMTNLNGNISYSIEIELDSDTLTEIKTVEERDVFGGRTVMDRPARTVEYLTLSPAQIQLLDTWVKILATVINKSGVFMTTGEKESVISELNAVLGIQTSYLTGINKPKDLEKRDLAWLRPEHSEIFMALGNYDRTPEWNSEHLHKHKIYQSLMSIPGGFYVSLKADGIRSWLFFSLSGIYLVDVQGGIVTQVTGRRTKHGRFQNILPGTILDVEIIGEFKPDGTLDLYQILVFDALAVSKVDVRTMTYTDRLRHVQEVVKFCNDHFTIDQAVQENLKGESVKDEGKAWAQIFQIQAKPVWRLPSPADINPELRETKINRHLKERALALEFFSILGAAAERSIYSNGEGVPQAVLGSRKLELDNPTPQKTGNILWYTDGIILTPADQGYLDRVDTFRQNVHPDSSLDCRTDDNEEIRASSNYSLVRKWKPLMTIDFRIRRTDTGSLTLMTNSFSAKKEIPFKNSRYPWNGNAEIDETMIGKIFEFRWGHSDLFSDSAFIPIRERSDKSTPNNCDVAMSIWILINDPITLEDLYGETTTGLRRYHNRVKTALLQEMAEKTGKQNPTLLDLGSGSGGDRTKWGPFSHVYAVEPDIQNLRELISRKQGKSSIDYQALFNQHNQDQEESTHDYYSKMSRVHHRSHAPHPDRNKKQNRGPLKRVPTITVINAGAENILSLQDQVPSGQIDCVTMFNALTFFYDSKEHLEQLIQTISKFLVPGGYCYMIAFDGELLLNSLQTSETEGDEAKTYDRIKTKNYSIAKVPDPSCRKIWIRIEGGIVRGQFEYLIDARELVKVMDVFGFRLLEERYLNEETLLSSEEYWFSSMFKVLKFRYFSNPDKREIENFPVPSKEKMETARVIIPLDPDDTPQEIVSTQLSKLGIKQLLRFGNPQDGSCYIHGVLRAFSKTYKQKTAAERTRFIVQLRKEMADNYTLEIHNAVGNGFFVSSQSPAYSYENVRASISQSTFWVSAQLLNYIGDQLQANVYILRGADAEVYKFGSTAGHITPGRKNIILYWINDNHYETVGQIENGNQVRLVFPDDHPLIVAIKKNF